MRLLIDALHPAHVHFFRHLAETVRNEGGEVYFTARQKDVTIELLEAFDLPFEVLTRIGGGFKGLIREMAVRTAKLTRRVQSFHTCGTSSTVTGALRWTMSRIGRKASPLKS